jgi:sialic acid synthase SpsE
MKRSDPAPRPASGVLVIAEAGVNHNGSLATARQLVRAARRAGADAVKFQTFTATKLARRDAPKAAYQRATTGEESQVAMLERLELTASDFAQLKATCDAEGIRFMSSPFDVDSLRLLVELGVDAIKLGSGELTNAQLLVEAGQTGLPVLLSTGMATIGEVEEALGALACGYRGPPCPAGRSAFRDAFRAACDRARLRDMVTLQATFQLRTGYSDHTQGSAVAVAAVARGATVIEKHFTLDRAMQGPDHAASVEPDELAALVDAIRQVERALGSSVKAPGAREEDNRLKARKSLVTLRPVAAGERFARDSLGAKRPATGVSAMDYYDWLGRVADRDWSTDEEIH